jgi:hypothetical protein
MSNRLSAIVRGRPNGGDARRPGQQRSGAATHGLVVGRFDAVQAHVVDTHISEQMRRPAPIGIETPALLHEADRIKSQVPPRAWLQAASRAGFTYTTPAAAQTLSQAAPRPS